MASLFMQLQISIHAPHEGERPDAVKVISFANDLISIHAPHEGERRCRNVYAHGIYTFQSTLPTRGSDYKPAVLYIVSWNFNPRSPRGGATSYCNSTTSGTHYFNPRSPRGGATSVTRAQMPYFKISIHAPHEGERHTICINLSTRNSISIHAPHEGERP